jgi:hypothetical protein
VRTQVRQPAASSQDQLDHDRWSDEGGSQPRPRPAPAAPSATDALTDRSAPAGAQSAATTAAKIAGGVEDAPRGLTPLRALCLVGLHSWPRVHGPWRSPVVAPSSALCRRCRAPVRSLWRTQYPADGSRCGRECRAHAAGANPA